MLKLVQYKANNTRNNQQDSITEANKCILGPPRVLPIAFRSPRVLKQSGEMKGNNKQMRQFDFEKS